MTEAETPTQVLISTVTATSSVQERLNRDGGLEGLFPSLNMGYEILKQVKNALIEYMYDSARKFTKNDATGVRY